MEHEYLTKYGLAERYGKTHHTITAWRRAGILPFTKTGYRTILYPVSKCDAALGLLTYKPRWLSPKDGAVDGSNGA
jgi:hypothetical protein